MRAFRSPQHKRRLTRRQTLAAAATVGVGLTVGSVIGVASARENDDSGYGGDGFGADAIVVHVRDAASGQLDVFVGERRLSVRDRDLARRLAKAARLH